MHNNYDNSLAMQQQVVDAMTSVKPLLIRGGNTKQFYGNESSGDVLDTRSHVGVVSYEPTELVITVRAGTLLKDVNAVLAAQNQMLAFEPPGFGDNATIGGTIACNFSGPRRPYTGAARDFILGCKIINGKAEILGFGGQVMKNVAGYDASRLMAGAMGTPGVVLDVSLKVLPKPDVESTVVLNSSVYESLHNIHQWQRLPMPISACSFNDKYVYLRLSGTDAAVRQAKKKIGGDELPDAATFWENVKEQKSEFFNTADNLWRISVPSNTRPLALDGNWFYDWGGAQRWLITNNNAAQIRSMAEQSGGHATLFRTDHMIETFQALAPGMMKVHQRLKQAFDPSGLFNRGRLYRDI